VKLLLDHNVSHRLCARLGDLYADSTQTRFLGFSRAGDSEIWFYARTHGYIIVTKDQDIAELAILRGPPPKVVWLRMGNCSTAAVEHLLRVNAEAIAELARNSEQVVLELFDVGEPRAT
jgi:predicted nuclease of predicted toxin-antitoxin system